MQELWRYFLVVLLSIVIILQILRIVKIIFEPKWLQHKLFAFPETKLIRVLYYLCSILVLLLVILLKLRIVE